jgi:hypothetical protein
MTLFKQGLRFKNSGFIAGEVSLPFRNIERGKVS